MANPLFLWVDFETDMLDKSRLTIMEAAWSLTTIDLTEIAHGHGLLWDENGWRATVKMDDFVAKRHEESGLAAALDEHAENGTSDSIEDEMDRLFALLSALEADVALAGSGVAAFDRPLIEMHWPMLAQKLLYWSMDIGPIRRAAKFAGCAEAVIGETDDAKIAHRAEADIRQAQKNYASFDRFLHEHGRH